MTPTAIAEAARLIVDARRQHRQLAALPESCRPTTAEDGYAVQRAVIAAWGEPVAGWKSGATAVPVQQRFGLTEPFLGAIFAPTVMHSPSEIAATRFEHRAPGTFAKPGVALEVEFAFRIGRDMAPKAAGYEDAEVLAAIDAVVPAVEIISPRYHEIPFGTPGSALADCGVNGGIVLGKPVADWRHIDYPSHKTSLAIDGRVVAEGTGTLVLGNPLKSLIWLVNGVGRMGHALSKGQVLTTGSMTGIVYADQGSHAVAEFGSLGRVDMRFV